MKKLSLILVLLSLNGCAVFTASPSLPAYLSAHATGVTTVATVGGIGATYTGLLHNLFALKKDVAQQTK